MVFSNYLFVSFSLYSVFNELRGFFRTLFKVSRSIETRSWLMPLVGPNGLEPSTSRLSGVRSNHLSYEPIYAVIANRFGGDGGDRTHDLLLARQALSQLSYTPIGCSQD